jgi:hypothetical protein
VLVFRFKLGFRVSWCRIKSSDFVDRDIGLGFTVHGTVWRVYGQRLRVQSVQAKG